jgi:hypothetical protein
LQTIINERNAIFAQIKNLSAPFEQTPGQPQFLGARGAVDYSTPQTNGATGQPQESFAQKLKKLIFGDFQNQGQPQPGNPQGGNSAQSAANGQQSTMADEFYKIYDAATKAGDAVDQSGKKAAVGLSNWKISLSGMKAGAISVFSTVKQGLASTLNAWIQNGKLSITALRKQISEQLKAYARQWAIEGAIHLIKGFYYASNPFTAWKAPREFVAGKGLLAQAAVAGIAGIGIGAGTGGAQAANGQAQNEANQNAGVREEFNPKKDPNLYKFEASVNLKVENIVKTDEGKTVRTLTENMNRNGQIRNLFIGSGDSSAQYQ